MLDLLFYFSWILATFKSTAHGKMTHYVLRSQSNTKATMSDSNPATGAGTMDHDALGSLDRNMQASFSKVFEKLDHLSSETTAIKMKVNEIEGAVAFNSEKVKEIEKDIIPKVKEDLETKIADLQNQLMAMEIYNRRANLLFYGIPEVNNEDVCKVVRNFIVNLGISEDEANNMAFVNAHRLPRR